MNLICFALFFIDMFMWIFLPLYFRDPRWGRGLAWDAHYIAAAYMTTTHVIEYVAVQIAYSKVNVEWSRSRIIHPLLYWILGLLAQVDFYSDIAMASEIYKWTMVKEHSTRYLGIYIISLITAVWQLKFLKKLIYFNVINYRLYYFPKIPKYHFSSSLL